MRVREEERVGGLREYFGHRPDGRGEGGRRWDWGKGAVGKNS